MTAKGDKYLPNTEAGHSRVRAWRMTIENHSNETRCMIIHEQEAHMIRNVEADALEEVIGQNTRVMKAPMDDYSGVPIVMRHPLTDGILDKATVSAMLLNDDTALVDLVEVLVYSFVRHRQIEQDVLDEAE